MDNFSQLEKVKKEEIDIGLSKRGKGRIIFLGFLFLVLLVVGAVIWQLFFTNRGVNFDIVYPKTTMVGENFPLYVQINNKSFNTLYNTKIVFYFPQGVYQDGLVSKNKIEIPLSTIKKGEKFQKTIKLTAVSPPKTTEKIKAVLKWRVSGFQVGLEKEKNIEIIVTKPAINLSLSLPKKIIPGVPFSVEVIYRNNLLNPIEGAILKIDLPSEFKVVSSEPDVKDFKNILLDKILANQQKRIIIKGVVSFSKQKNFSFGATVGFNDQEEKFLLVDQQKGTVSVSGSLLPVELTLNGSRDYIAHLGEDLTYTIKFSNKTEVALSDVVVKAYLKGDLFDFRSVISDGYFDSLNNVITWNGGNNKFLKLIGSQENGQVSFNVKLKRKFPQQNFKKNYYLDVKVEVESLSIPYYVAANKLVGSDEIKNKIRGDLDFQCLAFFRDAKSGFINNGPWPLKVNQPTEFTVHFLIKNYATDLENVKVKSVLGDGAVFEGLGHFKKIGNFPDPVYNERTNELSWSIANIPAWQGIKSLPLELIFQVKLTPSLNKVGLGIDLIKYALLEAKDSFSGLTIIKKCPAIKTNNLYLFDKTIKPSEGIVGE